MVDLKDELEQRAPWLFHDSHFRVTSHNHSLKHMGDSIAELRSDVLRIRFIRDSSRIQVELAPPAESEPWMELGLLWYTITGQRPEPELEGWIWFLRDHLSELAAALGPKFPQTKQQFERRQQECRKVAEHNLPPLTLAGRLRRFRATPSGMMLMGPFGWIIAVAAIACVFLGK